MSGSNDKVLCFQGYTLDLRRGCLSRGDQQVELRPKSFALLSYLVENSGRLAPKDELVAAVWGDVAVTDVSLARCVSDVRLALQDRAQEIIRTVPRRGYLFAASVSEVLNGDVARAPVPPLAHVEGFSCETRQLTVMSCELVGLMAAAAQRHLEDLREATTWCHRRCSEVIARHHGHLSGNSGGTLLYLFGYPDAREQDAENSVLAALALQELAQELSVTFETELQICIGIATGIVAIGTNLVAVNGAEQPLVGEPLILSERLRALAEPGQIAIAQCTRRLVGGLFEYRDLGRFALKGLTNPVDVSQVLGNSSVESRFEAHHPGRLTPLVGREDEIALLLRRWRQATRGEGSIALLAGEPGIGKSRVTQTMVEFLRDQPHEHLRLFCSPHRQDSVLFPIIGHIERAADFRRGDTDEQRLVKLEGILARASKVCSDAVPLVADLLSVPTGNRYPPRSPLTPQQRKEKTLAVLLAHIEGLAASRPLLLVIEDVHWSDPTSLELIDLIVERAPRLRLLAIVTFRPEFVPPWVGRVQTATMTLGRLPTRHSAEIVAAITRNKRLPKPAIDEILDRADGIPLFVEELTKAVLESGLADGNGRFANTELSSALDIPTTLHASLLARLDRLGSAREVAQIGAALGRRFSHSLIVAAATMPQQKVEEALVRLVDAELLRRRGNPPHAEYTFKHALVQDAAYATLLPTSRRALHARIAGALESNFADISEGQPELLAYHGTEAGLIEKASLLWSKAGQMSLARSALKEAEVQLTRALSQIETLPGTPTLRRERIKIQIALATALMHTKGYAAPETRAALDQARLFAEQSETLGERPDDPLQLFSVLHGFWVANHVAFNGDAVRDLATQLMALAEKAGTTFPLVLGHRVMGTSLLFLGDIAEGRAHLDRAMTLYNPTEHRHLGTRFGQEGGVAILSNRPLALWLLGYPDAALKGADEALSYARDLGQTASFLYAATRIAWLHLVVGNYTTAADQIRTLVKIAEQIEGSYWRAAATILQGCLFALTGEASTAINLITSGIAASRLPGANLLRMPWYLSCLARAHIKLGQMEEAQRCIDDAMMAMKTTKETWQESEIYCILGEVALISSNRDVAKAQSHFERALTVARRQKAKSWELRSAMRLARLLWDRGHRQNAHRILVPIYKWFTEGRDTPDLEEAKTLLLELAA